MGRGLDGVNVFETPCIILNTTEAIGGAFRVISLLVIPNPDYEGVLDDRRDQITETLNPCCSSNQVISRWNYSKQQ